LSRAGDAAGASDPPRRAGGERFERRRRPRSGEGRAARNPAGTRIAIVVLLPVVLLWLGTVGYKVIEGWSWYDALYMSVITLTTVGFGEVHPLSRGGRAFTMFLSLGGIFTLFYAGTEAARAIITGEIRALFGRRRMEKRIADLQRHVIVCGYGRVGQYVCDEFSRRKVAFVVVDRDPHRLTALELPHGHTLVGDATTDVTLREAGIDRARALVVVVATDADNLFITMSARLLNDKIPIIARAEEGATIEKLRRAGATRVVSPYLIGGNRVAEAVLNPAVVDLIEVATKREHLDLQIEEVEVGPQSPLPGRTVAETGLRTEIGLILVAIKRGSGHMEFNPADQARMQSGDTLIVMGRREQLDRAERFARGPAT
jgi:voltage-gated potassium channel